MTAKATRAAYGHRPLNICAHLSHNPAGGGGTATGFFRGGLTLTVVVTVGGVGVAVEEGGCVGGTEEEGVVMPERGADGAADPGPRSASPILGRSRMISLQN